MSGFRRRGPFLTELRALLDRGEPRPLARVSATDPRDRCSLCGEFATVVLTVVDALGHESLACAACWRQCAQDQAAAASRRT